MMLTLARSGRPEGVTLVHFLHSSRVTQTRPSSEPVQIVPRSSFEGAIVKIVANTSGPFISPVIGPPDGPSVFGSARVRSGLIFSQLCPSSVVFHKCCDEMYRTFGS